MGFLISASIQEAPSLDRTILRSMDLGVRRLPGMEVVHSSLPGIEFRQYEVTREREALSANFESRVNETSTFYLQGAYNYFSDQGVRSRTEIKLEDGTVQSLTDSSAVVTDIEETDRDLKNRFEEQESTYSQ